MILCAVAIVPTSAVAAVADSFEPDDSFSAAKPLTVDAAAQQHTIFPAGDQDWVSFTVTTGKTYEIRTVAGTPPEAMDTVLYLYDSNGTTLIDSNDDAKGTYSRIDYTADANKTVYAKVVSYFRYESGAYALSVTKSVAAVADSFEPDNSSGAAKPITVDAAAQQHTVFPAGDQDWVSFTVEVGWTYTIETAAGTPSEDMDTVLYLYDSNGTTRIDSNDDFGSLYSRIDYTGDADKTVYAKVVSYFSYESGAYALSVTKSVAAVADEYEPDASYLLATPVTVGGPAQQHTIHFDDDEDWVSFATQAGWRYAIETAPGASPEDPDTYLYLYDSSGMIVIASNDDHTGRYSRVVYEAEADQVLYAMVQGDSTGTYALSLSRTPILKIGVVPESVDFGSVAVGNSLRRTVVVENQGVAPLEVGDVQLEGAGFSIVRDDAGGIAIPVGESREIEVAYTPTVAYTGAPSAVQHDWTNVVAQWNYSSGFLVSVSLFTGLQNLGGAGDLGWRVRIGATDWTGAGAVVAGGRYTMRVNVSPGPGTVVQVLEPVGDSFSVSQTGSTVFSVAYFRVPDASLSIASNDDDEAEVYVDLFGVALPASGGDTTPPTVTDNADAAPHQAFTLVLTPSDGAGSGVAATYYRIDGGAWKSGTSVSLKLNIRHKRPGLRRGVHTIEYYAVDAAGNAGSPQSCQVTLG